MSLNQRQLPQLALIRSGKNHPRGESCCLDNAKRDSMRTLPDYLRKGMKMILVGPNPGDRSARVGHYYAGRANQFWPILYESGVIPEPLSYEDDRRMLEFGIGMTDLVKRPTRDRRRDRAPGVRRRARAAGAEARRHPPAGDRLQRKDRLREIRRAPVQAGPAEGKALRRPGVRPALDPEANGGVTMRYFKKLAELLKSLKD